MNIKTLKDYIRICKFFGIEPTWKGLSKFIVFYEGNKIACSFRTE